MHIILSIIALIIIYTLIKKYFLQVVVWILIASALYFYTKITIYSFIGIFILSIGYFLFNKQQIKEQCIQPLKNNDFENFFKKYGDYSIDDKKTVIDIIKEDFENLDDLLPVIFDFDFSIFCEEHRENSSHQIIFEKSDCITYLRKIWGEETDSLLNNLKKELNFEEFTITKENDKKTILIKIIPKEKTIVMNDNNFFKNAISLDD